MGADFSLGPWAEEWMKLDSLVPASASCAQGSPLISHRGSSASSPGQDGCSVIVWLPFFCGEAVGWLQLFHL